MKFEQLLATLAVLGTGTLTSCDAKEEAPKADEAKTKTKDAPEGEAAKDAPKDATPAATQEAGGAKGEHAKAEGSCSPGGCAPGACGANADKKGEPGGEGDGKAMNAKAGEKADAATEDPPKDPEDKS